MCTVHIISIIILLLLTSYILRIIITITYVRMRIPNSKSMSRELLMLPANKSYSDYWIKCPAGEVINIIYIFDLQLYRPSVCLRRRPAASTSRRNVLTAAGHSLVTIP